MGWRLLPDMPFGTSGIVAMIFIADFVGGRHAVSGVCTPETSTARSRHLAGRDFWRWDFSRSLLILTLLRDMVLLAGFAAKRLADRRSVAAACA